MRRYNQSILPGMSTNLCETVKVFGSRVEVVNQGMTCILDSDFHPRDEVDAEAFCIFAKVLGPNINVVASDCQNLISKLCGF